MNCQYCNNPLTISNEFGIYEIPLECKLCDYRYVHNKKNHFISLKVPQNESYYEILLDYRQHRTTISKYIDDGPIVEVVVTLKHILNITPTSAPLKLKTILTFL